VDQLLLTQVVAAAEHITEELLEPVEQVAAVQEQVQMQQLQVAQ
jgi:hypothetical protein